MLIFSSFNNMDSVNQTNANLGRYLYTYNLGFYISNRIRDTVSVTFIELDLTVTKKSGIAPDF